MLNAHTDTVGVAGMDQPFNPRIEGDKLHGRGAFDMKGGLAAAMIATRELAALDLAGDVILAAVSDEEHASVGTASIGQGWKADAAIITEPTGLTITTAHKGFTWLEIESAGVAAHGSRPDLGVDAIAKMGKILVAIEDLDANLRGSVAHPLIGTGSIHASLISGGQELSSYPASCKLDVERRTIPGESPDIVEQQLQTRIDRLAASDPALQATLKVGLIREPYEIDRDHPLVNLLQRQVRTTLGFEPEITGGLGWMDSALLGAAGIPTVIFGPDGEGAHAVEEWVDLPSVRNCVETLIAVGREFCG